MNSASIQLQNPPWVRILFFPLIFFILLFSSLRTRYGSGRIIKEALVVAYPDNAPTTLNKKELPLFPPLMKERKEEEDEEKKKTMCTCLIERGSARPWGIAKEVQPNMSPPARWRDARRSSRKILPSYAHTQKKKTKRKEIESYIPRRLILVIITLVFDRAT